MTYKNSRFSLFDSSSFNKYFIQMTIYAIHFIEASGIR